MPRWVLLVAVVVMGLGCGVPPLEIDRSKLVDPPAGAAEAAALTCAAFGIANCPQMWFYAADVERCYGETFFYDGGCYGGLQGSNGILLVVTPSTKKASDTPIAHEMAHWRWGDPGHSDAETWGSAPEYNWGLREAGCRVGEQTLALAAAGL